MNCTSRAKWCASRHAEGPHKGERRRRSALSPRVHIKRPLRLNRGASRSRRIAGGAIRPKGRKRNLAASAADVDAANGRSARRHVSGPARSRGGRNAATCVRIGTATGVRFSSAGTCSIQPTAGAIATTDAGASTGSPEASLVPAGGGHGERPGTATAGHAKLGTGLCGHHCPGSGATPTARGPS